MLHLNGFLVFSFPHELIRICHFKFTFWVKLCAPNLTFERLLSFMNWFGMRNHYSDDVFEKKLCHNDLHSFLPSRTDSICLFRTYLYVRNFYNTHYIITTLHRCVNSDIFLEKKFHHRHCIYIEVVSFMNWFDMPIHIFIFRKTCITDIYSRVLG